MNQDPVVLRNLNDVRSVIDEKSALTFTPPDGWRDSSFSGLKFSNNYTVSTPVQVDDGLSTFGAKLMTVKVKPFHGQPCAFVVKGERAEIAPTGATIGYRNIKIGQAAICEHPLSLRAGLGLQGDFDLSSSSFPSFPNGLAPLLRGLEGNLVDLGPARFVAVKSPIAFIFKSGAFMAVEPPETPGKLSVDHRFSHPRNVLGEQRMRMDVEPDTYAFIARARTICYRWWTSVAKVLSAMHVSQLPRLGLNGENVLFVDSDRLLNPRRMFDAIATSGRIVNREAICHEVIDKLGAIGLMRDRLAGKVTTFRTTHADDVAAIQRLADVVS